MRYRTEMMNAILTSKKAQEIINYVSPVYGQSYVGLWVYQAIGTVLDEVYEIAEKMFQETGPATADLLLDLWEQHYGIPKDSALNVDQRRLRLISKGQIGGPCNPYRLAQAVSSVLGGVKVDVVENTAKNTFIVNIRDYIEDLSAARTVIDRMKPAHLIYEIRVAEKVDLKTPVKTAVVMTYCEKINVEVAQ